MGVYDLSGNTLKVQDIRIGANSQADSGTLIASPTSGSLLVVPAAVQENITTNTAVSLLTYLTTISTGAALPTITLADATSTGQLKRIQMIADVGDATVTFNGTATIVFADVGDTADLMFNGTDWIPIALYNTADGVTAPVYTAAA